VREAVAIVRKAQGDIEAALEALRAKGGQPARPADDDLAQLVVHNIEKSLVAPSAALSAALAIAKHEEAAPEREAQRAEAKRQAEALAKQMFDDERRRGVHGPAEQERVLAELRASMRRQYPGNSDTAKAARGTRAAAELEVYRANLSMNGLEVSPNV
jgi:hypothetical protein